jgi:succinate dehydrogenase/fumarate reductase flavoprotein subunit
MTAATAWDAECDVLVVGMGAAGCAAAIEAHDRGATVIILEKMGAGREGGNTRVSGGIWFDNTDPERAAVYLKNLCAGFPVPDEVVQVWAEETHANSAWIRSLGGTVGRHGDFRPEYSELDGSDCYGGYLGIDGQMGRGLLFGVLSAAVRQRGVEVRLDTRARTLITVDGEIAGVAAEHQGRPTQVRAHRAVVLASGGFEANPEMVHDYLGLAGVPGNWGSPAGTGDGIRMAQQVGADLWHMDNMMTAPGLRVPGFDSAFYTPFIGPLAYIYVGLDGTRFVDETTIYRHGHALRHGRYELYPTQPMRVVFDESARLAGPLSPGNDILPVGWNLVVEGYRWSADNRTEIEKGWIKKGNTLAELAGELGLDADQLESTVERYNKACANGRDEQFGRSPETLLAISDPPFYGFDCGPMLGWSNGGPRRNERAQVEDTSGAVIPRLYAAGNISSTYSWCKDGGFHVADALAFGRVAGRWAAREGPQNDAASSEV